MSASDPGELDEQAAEFIDEHGLGPFAFMMRIADQVMTGTQKQAHTEPARDGIGVRVGPGCPLEIPPWLREDWPDDIRFAHVSRGEDYRIVIRPGRRRWSQAALRERARIEKELRAIEDGDEQMRLRDTLFKLRAEQPIVPIDPEEETDGDDTDG